MFSKYQNKALGVADDLTVQLEDAKSKLTEAEAESEKAERQHNMGQNETTEGAARAARIKCGRLRHRVRVLRDEIERSQPKPHALKHYETALAEFDAILERAEEAARKVMATWLATRRPGGAVNAVDKIRAWRAAIDHRLNPPREKAPNGTVAALVLNPVAEFPVKRRVWTHHEFVSAETGVLPAQEREVCFLVDFFRFSPKSGPTGQGARTSAPDPRRT
jgi:hypothetical protein